MQGVLTETTAELAASLSLAAARRIVEADQFMRAGLYDGWLPHLSVVSLFVFPSSSSFISLIRSLLILLSNIMIK
jgi:lactate dehydrogenase-like 2-hydroxyacid dehydrogenase